MLAVNEEFYSIQGEGEMNGTPMYFVRLQGCGVGCPFCDTKQTWKKGDANVEEVDIVKRARRVSRWMCITGGEPGEHDCSKLIHKAQDCGINVMVESSGFGDMSQFSNVNWLVVSPKDRFTRKKEASDITHAHELKCVVTGEEDIIYYLDKYEKFLGVKTFQPVDNNGKIAELCLRWAKDDWKIRGQQHVLFGLR